MTLHPGKEIRRLRKARGWTQGKCAEVLGTTRYTTNEWENERRGITPGMARVLARTFPEHSALDWLIMQAKYDLEREAQRT